MVESTLYKNSDPEIVAQELAWQFQQRGIDINKGPALTALIKVQAERVKTLAELADKSRFFYEDIVYDEKAAKTNLTLEALPTLQAVHDQLAKLPKWEEQAIHAVVNDVANNFGIKLGIVAQPLRVAVTGNTISPPIDVTLYLLGKEKVIQRLEQAMQMVAAV